MKRALLGFALIGIGFAAGGCGDASGQAEPAAKQTVREPAVAGLFYPAAAKDLSGQVQRLLAKAENVPLGKLRVGLSARGLRVLGTHRGVCLQATDGRHVRDGRRVGP